MAEETERNAEAPADARLISEARVAEVDAKWLDPNERAERVWAEIQEKLDPVPKAWDLVCFCTQFFAQWAIGVGGLPLTIARGLSNYIFAVHYSEAEKLYAEEPLRQRKGARATQGTLTVSEPREKEE